MTRFDQLPNPRTQPREQEVPPAWTPETGPQADQQSPASHKKRGKAAMIVAGILTTAGVGGWFGLDAVTGDSQAKGPSDTDRSTSAPEKSGTQTEKAPETKLSGLTDETMPFYGPDGEKLTGVSKLNEKVASFNEGVTEPNQAFQNTMEKQIGYIANTGTSKEATGFYQGSANDMGDGGPALTAVERKNDVITSSVNPLFAEPSPFLQQNRDQLIDFTTSVHNSLVEDAVELGAAKDWRDNLRFVIDSSSVDKDGNHMATGHYEPDGMMVEADWKDYFESHIFVGTMVKDEQGNLKLGGFGIFDKPAQSEN